MLDGKEAIQLSSQAEVKVKVERRSDCYHLNLDPNLNRSEG